MSEICGLLIVLKGWLKMYAAPDIKFCAHLCKFEIWQNLKIKANPPCVHWTITVH